MSFEIVIDGQIYGTGLRMPSIEDQTLLQSLQTYPDHMLLEDSEIKRGLEGDYYLQSRKQLSPWIINQSNLGKCNASAVQGAIDQIRLSQGMPHVPLSDCHLYMNINGGSDRGSSLIEGFRYAQSHGISPRTITVNGKSVTLPNNVYNRRQVPADVLRVADAEAKRFCGWEWYKAPTDYASYKRAIASALARRQPVVFAWHVGSNSSRLRNGYVQTGNGPGNHANVFHSAKWVGGSDIVHPDNRNSWGPSKDPMYGPQGGSWGDDGFALFTMSDAFACAKYHATYIVTSVGVDPKDNFI